MIKFNHVSYTYALNTPNEYKALDDVTFEINDGEFVAIIGYTGSGKSTLLQHINGLLFPTSGEVVVNKYHMNNKTKVKEIHTLRKEAGLVFQFPEYQLFEETVEKDIAFGPKNFGMKDEEIKIKTKELMELVGLKEELLSHSPFELSGGQKRRVAICGILAMEPSILVLDEPTAGLDSIGTNKSLNLFKKINEQGKTVVLVTHDMDIVLKYASRVILLENGQVRYDGSPVNIFNNEKLLASSKIEQPHVFSFANKLIKKGYNIDLYKVKDVDSLVKEILKNKGGVKHE